MNISLIKKLLYRIADDKLIMGHRTSEWIGMGPILEEDIAFGSMAQDEVGHAQAYYQILHELGEPEPDEIAFTRPESRFYCCHLVEYPTQDYAFALMRHFLFDMADKVRLDSLKTSSYAPLAQLAAKLAKEEKYHQMHAIVFVKELGLAGTDSNQRMQTALNEAFPMALSLFEPTEEEEAIASEGIMNKESELESQWMDVIRPILRESGLHLPVVTHATAHYGGRKAQHTPHLAPLLAEMTEVFAIDPQATW